MNISDNNRDGKSHVWGTFLQVSMATLIIWKFQFELYKNKYKIMAIQVYAFELIGGLNGSLNQTKNYDNYSKLRESLSTRVVGFSSDNKRYKIWKSNLKW